MLEEEWGLFYLLYNSCLSDQANFDTLLQMLGKIMVIVGGRSDNRRMRFDLIIIFLDVRLKEFGCLSQWVFICFQRFS